MRRSDGLFLWREKNDKPLAPALGVRERRIQVEFVGAKLSFKLLARIRVVEGNSIRFQNARYRLFERDWFPFCPTVLMQAKAHFLEFDRGATVVNDLHSHWQQSS